MMPRFMAKYDECVELHRSGQISEAIAGLLKLTEEFPDFALPFNALAAVRKKEGKLLEAVQYMEMYCRIEPNDPFGFSILSSYCIAAGDHEGAENALAKVGELRFKEQMSRSPVNND